MGRIVKAMKAALTAFLIVSFVGIAVFGVFAMSHEMGHGQSCIAAAARGTDCPQSLFPLIALHFDTFKNFSTAIFGNVLLAFLVSLLAVGLVARIRAASPPLPVGHRLRELSAARSLSFKRKSVRWLSLHINSPAYA